MSHNKSRQMQSAARLLEQVLAIDTADPHALPGSAVGFVKQARTILLRDVRKRRDGRERELVRRGTDDTGALT